jgi:hypothetical protein
MCKESLPVLFTIISSFMLISLFALALINMIFCVLTPRNFDTFIEPTYHDDYKKVFSQEFLMDLNFGNELEYKHYYAQIATLKNLCAIGVCNMETTNKVTENCTEACLHQTRYCYDEDKRCKSKTCTAATKSQYGSICRDFNRIQFWRNTEFFRNTERYRMIPYVDIVPKDKDCKYGFKKCGIVNEQKDYLCLKIDKQFECPINEIIVKSNNESIGEGYRSFKLGDKYLFISHDKTDNYLITNLSITLDTDNNYDLIQVDSDSFVNLSTYNYILLDDTDIPQYAFLNAVPFKSNYTYEGMSKAQELIDKKKGIFTEKKLEEMNSEALQYKMLMYGLGIATFCIVGVFTIIIYPIYCCDCSSNYDCRDCTFLCSDEFSLKHVLLFYVIGIPIAVLLIFDWIVTIIKKASYNKLSSMEYIEEYKNMSKFEIVEINEYPYEKIEFVSYDFFENSIKYNNLQFIILLIAIILIILYPIIILLLFGRRKKKNSIINNDELYSKPTQL